MADLIDRQAVLDAFTVHAPSMSYNKMFMVVANAPTIDPESLRPKWISVEDGLPDTIPCGAGTVYSEAVNVLTTGRKVLTAIFDGEDFICDAEFWEAEGEEVTHWTPVLLPLPEPPNADMRGEGEGGKI